MFTQTWKKYLPVIIILLKRSVNGDQVLKMNLTDFERAAGGRKIKYSFTNLLLTNGKINNMVQHSHLAKELGVLLQEDEHTRKLIQKQHLEFSMSNDIKLTIKNNTPPADAAEEQSAEETTEMIASGMETGIANSN